jgi:hypothetical protein
VSDDIDFFISYNSADGEWAEWIAWILEKDGGYTACYQLRDFPPGTNFVSGMDDAAARSRHLIAVLSPAYLKADFTGPEWWAAFARDPRGTNRRLIPVMVSRCEPGGLLASIVSIRLMGLEEADARDALLRGVARYPATGQAGTWQDDPPKFPGTVRPKTAGLRPQAPPVFGQQATAPPEPRETAARSPAPPPPPEPAAPRVPWTALGMRLPVRWEDALSPAVDQGTVIRLELHLIPLFAPQDTKTPLSPFTQGALVSAGRQNGIFPSAATVSIHATTHDVAAVLADDGSPTAGLRISSGGQRSAWLTLPPTPSGDMASAVTSGLARLLPAVASLRPPLPERVALAAGISGAGRQAQLGPRDSLPSRYLHSHTQQVAGELARKLTGTADTDR